MLPLSPRLLCCVSMIEGEVVCDVGTDHALLPVYLLQSGICRHILATDIRRGPLQSAKHTITRYGVADRVTLCLSNGLQAVPPATITDVVIAGMGGETIRDILVAPEASWLQRGTNLVLQPMTKAAILRTWLAENGFTLSKEVAVKDTHLYTVMQARYTGQRRTLTLTERLVGELNAAEPLTRIYLAAVLVRLDTRLHGLLGSGAVQEAEETRQQMACIHQFLATESEPKGAETT